MSPSKLHDDPHMVSQPQIVDLPVLRKKPSYNELLKTLQDLKLSPTSWNGTSKNHSTTDAKSVSQYLTSIISSDLSWLDKDSGENDGLSDQKDELWELASKRLAERCGRSAMPEMTRIWTLPATILFREFKFEIREPPLTEDNLGLKTWGTAFAIVKKLHMFGRLYFDHLLHPVYPSPGTYTPIPQPSSATVLELGSGTGLVGIAAARIWGLPVLLTDLPEIKENLLFNIRKNSEVVEARRRKVVGDILDWKDPDSLKGYKSKEFEIVIAADPLYDDDHPKLVAENIKRYLKLHHDSRALVAVPMRDSHTKSMAEELKQLMQEHGFDLIHQGEVICHDDWAQNEEEVVKCWWGIWEPRCAE